jgi:hypothetical protein
MKHIKLRGFYPNPERLKEIEECALWLSAHVAQNIKVNSQELVKGE